jgi:protein-S-isoprenylcysteine O-methyltransferase Ste14
METLLRRVFKEIFNFLEVSIKDVLLRKELSLRKYRNVALLHLLFEIWALWAVSKELPPNFGKDRISQICPLSTTLSSRTQNIYPNKRLPIQAIVSLCLITFGGFVRASCHRRLGKMFTWEASVLEDHKLITHGPYRFVRHPSYTALLSVCSGYTLFLFTAGTFGKECFIGSGTIFLESLVHRLDVKGVFGFLYVFGQVGFFIEAIPWVVRRSFVEDEVLKRKFGKEWEEWARKVRWNVIPYIL